MYSDESGDPGLKGSQVKYFILSGLIIHELRWFDILESLIEFRRELRDTTGLKLREEIHAKDFISSPGELIRIKRNIRLDILKRCIDWAKKEKDLNIITVRVNKANYKDDVDIFELAWKAFIQRFENTLSYRNFRGPGNPDDRGFLLTDNTNGKKLTSLLRKMRRFNYIKDHPYYGTGSRNVPLRYIIEDPVYRDSAHSYFHQIIDVISYFAKQKYDPNKYMRKKGGRNFYDRLEPVLVKEASTYHPLGIVEL